MPGYDTGNLSALLKTLTSHREQENVKKTQLVDPPNHAARNPSLLKAALRKSTMIDDYRKQST